MPKKALSNLSTFMPKLGAFSAGSWEEFLQLNRYKIKANKTNELFRISESTKKPNLFILKTEL
jgi:hypothetical protein